MKIAPAARVGDFSTKEFKLLQVAQSSIANASTGVQQRNYHLALQLSRKMTVSHLGFHNQALSWQESNISEIEVTSIPKPKPYSLAILARSLVGRMPASIRNHQSPQMAEALVKALASYCYDIVQIEGVEMCSYLDIVRSAANRPKYVVMDWHNIESEVAYRYSRNAAKLIHRLYMRRALSQIKTVEDRLLSDCDIHLVMSEREREELLTRKPDARIWVIGNGVDVDCFTEQLPIRDAEVALAQRHRVLFVGTMDYYPNVDAALYFATEMWPAIHRRLPDCVFTIVGRNPPEVVRKLAERPAIEVTGAVPDLRAYYRTALLAVVPLRMGGGTRLKILESMAAGVPVISTSLGAEGLDAQPGTQIEIADTPNDFVLRIDQLRRDYRRWQELSVAGRDLVERHYDWKNIGSSLATKYVNLLNDVQDQPPVKTIDSGFENATV